MKRLTVIAGLFLVMALPFVSCSKAVTPPPTPPDEPSPPITEEVSFPDGAPPLNHKAKLNCIVKAPAISLKNMSIEIRLPEAFELVSGELSWVGDISSGDELEVISAVVKAIKIGNWAIKLRNSIDPEKQGGFSMYPDWREVIYVSIFNDSADWGEYPPWYRSHGGVIGGIYRQGDPLIITQLYMAISHPPLLNEPAELLCTAISRNDFPDFKAQVVLPEGAVLVSGNPEWQGDLKAGVPVTLWAKIIFKKTGNWQIDAGAWRWFEGEYSWNVKDSIYLTIGIKHSEFGEPPKEDMGDRPVPPTIPSVVSP